MLTISKMADYGTLIMVQMAMSHPSGQSYNAKDISQAVKLPLPTVSKLLKQFANGGLLDSLRGAKGGYRLAQAATQISLAQIIRVADGGVALTECSHVEGKCSLEQSCVVRHNWQLISRAMVESLERITLDQLTKPMTAVALSNTEVCNDNT